MTDETRTHSGLMAAGRNPHYKPPLNRWRTVEIKLPPGLIAGVILDSDLSGALCIVVVPGTEWPENIELERGMNGTIPARVITAEAPFFKVTNEERGPAVGHEFEPERDQPDRCKICACNESGVYVRDDWGRPYPPEKSNG